jgi:flagellar assembly protein FliH
MTSSSPEVLRGAAAAAVTPARLSGELRLGMPRARSAREEEELAALRAGARAEGYAAGWAEGSGAAHAAVRAEADRAAAAAAAAGQRQVEAVARAVAALDVAAGELERRVVPAAEAIAAQVADAAVAVAEALLGRELAAVEPGAAARDAVRRALALAPEGRPVVVRLSPADAAVVSAASSAEQLGGGREIRWVADPAVEPGGSVVECDATRIDAQLGPALARVREVLTP